VRVEVNYPGSTLAHSVSDTDKPLVIDWNNTYLSSELRSFRIEPCYVSRVVI